MPNDVVSVDDETYQAIMNGVSDGKVWGPDATGNPELVDPPAPTQEETIALAEDKKSQLLQEINSKTQIWQTQLALAIITDADKASLIAWMKYAQVVQSVDTSKAPDVMWPTSPKSN